MRPGQSLRTFSLVLWFQAGCFINRAIWAASSKSLSQQQDFPRPSVVSCSKQCFLSTWEEELARGSKNPRQSGSPGGLYMWSSLALHPMSDCPGQYSFHSSIQLASCPLGQASPCLCFWDYYNVPPYFEQKLHPNDFCPLISALPS